MYVVVHVWRLCRQYDDFEDLEDSDGVTSKGTYSRLPRHQEQTDSSDPLLSEELFTFVISPGIVKRNESSQ